MSERLDRWLISALGFVVALAVILAIGALLPHLLVPTELGHWDGPEGAAAFYARQRVAGAGGAGQKAMRMRVSVVDVAPDPSGCDWGYAEPASGTVTVRTYTFYGLAWETWVVGCRSESLRSQFGF